jgi:hypothetical protein
MRRQSIPDPHRIPDRKSTVSDQPVADLYAAIEDPRNLPKRSSTADWASDQKPQGNHGESGRQA